MAERKNAQQGLSEIEKRPEHGQYRSGLHLLRRGELSARILPRRDQEKARPRGFEEFNYHRLSGKTLTMQELNEAVEAMPMMAERTLVVVTDCDLFKLPEDQRTARHRATQRLPAVLLPRVCV